MATERYDTDVPYRLCKKMKKHRRPFEPQGKTTKFVIRVEGNTVNIWLNEDLLIENQEIEDLSDSPSIRLAIGAKYSWNGSILTYKNLEIEPVEPEK